MTQEAKFYLLLMVASVAVFLLALSILDELMYGLDEQEDIPEEDLVPPWMAAQVQEEARDIIRGVMPDDAE